MGTSTCRICDAALSEVFADLGTSPLCQRHVVAERAGQGEMFYPLRAYVCTRCWLVQVSHDVSPAEIFDDYAYFSSYSTSWVEHARRYVEEIVPRLGLGRGSRVVEVASNDGYLLQHFRDRNIPALGIEPARNVAERARERSIETWVRFFGVEAAREIVDRKGLADLWIGNNVLAHVPDPNDFIEGIRLVLAPEGVATLEFPHLLQLVEHNEFDTIYHEHFSYFSFDAAEYAFRKHGLKVFDVAELPTHGGSLRMFVAHQDSGHRVAPSVAAMRDRERTAGVRDLEWYRSFDARIRETKRKLVEFLIGAKRQGRSVVGYGAPGKGNTLLNYCGIGTDFLDYTVDRNPKKQGNYLPGSRIPIEAPEKIFDTRPDYVLLLPWNLEDEIVEQMAGVSSWGGRFVVPIPELRVLEPPE